MYSLFSKLAYLKASLWRSQQPTANHCSSCGFPQSRLVARKYLITTLRRCDGCHLLFRCPTECSDDASSFYENTYRSGFTTELPSPEQLDHYLHNQFANTPKDFRRFLTLFDNLSIAPGARILDLGCSWGYVAWQFQQAGYRVKGYELSSTRASFARDKLKLDVVSSLSEVHECFDVIFSSHVLEHVPALSQLLNWCFSHLTHNGLFVAITPNGSDSFRQSFPRNWSNMWGGVHPLFLDSEFWQAFLFDRPYLLASDLGNAPLIRHWTSAADQRIGTIDGWELLVVARSSSLATVSS